ncbi:peptidase A24, partial [Methanosarcinales archaeon]
PISGLRDRHIKLIENYIYKDGKVRQEFSRSGVVIDDSVMRRLEQLTSRGLIGDRVWVTPGLPFMIPITAGFISATLYGDMLFHGVMLFLCR